MKKLILLILVLLYTPINADNKWIAPTKKNCIKNGGDFDKYGCSAKWEKAKNICLANGNGIRLPLIDELKELVSTCGGINPDNEDYEAMNKNSENKDYLSCLKKKGLTSLVYWSLDKNYIWFDKGEVRQANESYLKMVGEQVICIKKPFSPQIIEKNIDKNSIEGNCVNGYGTHSYSNGDKYVGEWKNGKKNGQGTYFWNDGNTYIGEFKNGEFYGQGTRYWNNGDKYVGEWKNGKKNGQGTYYYSSGNKYVGEWKDNEKHGQGIKYFTDGDKIVGNWQNDEFISSQSIITQNNNTSNNDVPEGEKIIGGLIIGGLVALFSGGDDESSSSSSSSSSSYSYCDDNDKDTCYENRQKLGDSIRFMCTKGTSKGYEKCLSINPAYDTKYNYGVCGVPYSFRYMTFHEGANAECR